MQAVLLRALPANETSKVPSVDEFNVVVVTDAVAEKDTDQVGVIVDRAKSFLGSFSEHIANRGCGFDLAAKVAAWRVAKAGRRGDLWQAMLKRVVWA
ncbi:unnamed protein product, partial [Prorocentrum cordatum]